MAGFVFLFIVPPIGIGGVVIGVILFCVASSQAKAYDRARAAAAARAVAELKQRQDAAMLAFEPLRREAQAALERLISVESRALELDRSAVAALQPMAKTIAQAREGLADADNGLADELRGADESYRMQRLTEYLERQFIARAAIPGLGPNRKAMLASFGVETAADVERRAIRRISGFGPHLTERLLSWRRNREQAFSQRDDVRAPPDWLQRIRQQHNAAVNGMATKLRGTLMEYRGVHASYDRQLAGAGTDLDRARRECRSALGQAKSV